MMQEHRESDEKEECDGEERRRREEQTERLRKNAKRLREFREQNKPLQRTVRCAPPLNRSVHHRREHHDVSSKGMELYQWP